MLKGEVFVGKGVAIINVYDAGTVVMHKITALYHKVLNHSVKTGAFITHRHTIRFIFAGAKLSEILSRLWCNICKQFHDNTTNFRISNADVEKDLKQQLQILKRL